MQTEPDAFSISTHALPHPFVLQSPVPNRHRKDTVMSRSRNDRRSREIRTHEYRVGLTPAGARELRHNGHDVSIEHTAGAGILPDGVPGGSRDSGRVC